MNRDKEPGVGAPDSSTVRGAARRADWHPKNRSRMILVGLAVVLLGVVALVAQKEAQLRSGTRIYLRLEPKDPQSLIEGDYMKLWYAVSNELFRDQWHGERREVPPDGYLVLGLDEESRAHFVRFDDGTGVQGGEVKLRYRVRQSFVRIASEAYYFEQGQGERFARAKWGELRVTPGGEALLVALCDEDLKRIEKRAPAVR